MSWTQQKQSEVVSSMDVRKAEQIRCTGGSPTDCGACESCVLKEKLNFARQWFTRLPETKKQKYIHGLSQKCVSLELICSLLGLLQPLQYKDFTYAKSKANLIFDEGISEKSLQPENTADYMFEDENWFLAASSWAKFNYLTAFFRFCNCFTLENIKSSLAKQYEIHRKQLLNSNRSTAQPSATTKRISTAEDEAPAHFDDRDEKLANSSFTLDSSSNGRLKRSAIILSQTPDKCFDDDGLLQEDDFALRSTPISKNATNVIKYFQQTNRLSARCYPFTGKTEQSRNQSDKVDSDTEQCISCEIEDVGDPIGPYGARTSYQALPKERDFIRRLPVHLSKYILGFLNQYCLINCVCVSKHWRFLAEQVRNDTLAQQIMREDVMLIQGSTEKIPNPVYARVIPLHVPKITEDGEVIENDQAKHVDITGVDEYFEERNMQNCYDGIETITVDVEERNVYCGAYNVLVLNNMKDNSRVTFYDGGKFVPVASIDRRIRLLDIKSGKCEKTIVEHVGSVKSVYTDENRGFVLSGSYDTTIRFWDIKNGRCQKIFLGHKSSVISLSIHGKYLASGSTDRTCKVWNLKTGKCLRTFKHRNIIHSATIGEQLLLTGCAGGKVRVWDFKGAKLIKPLDGHMGPITCTTFDDNHIITGSKDCYAMVWSTKGNFTRCLQTLRHPKEVNCLETMYCRVVTGSLDGKIRVWNILTGECLRIIRGNSRNDPITALYASEDRLVINTKSNLLLYNFEAVNWDYAATAERESNFLRKRSSFLEDRRKQSHAFNRAQTARLKGPQHVLSSPSITVDQSNGDAFSKKSEHIDRSKRAQSAPAKHPTSASIQRHISRIQSAVAIRNGHDQQISHAVNDPTTTKKPHGILKHTGKRDILQTKPDTELRVKNAWTASPSNGLLNQRATIKPRDEGSNTCFDGPKVIARSRSAPAHRIRSVPSCERGFTSSSEVSIKVWDNNVHVPPTQNRIKMRPFSASAVAMQSPVDTHMNLKLKTFYQQLEFEAALAGKS